MVKLRLHLHFDAALNKDTCCKYVSTPKNSNTKIKYTIKCVDVAFARQPYGFERARKRIFVALVAL